MTKVVNLNGEIKTINSREVAKMVGKAHNKLLRDIRTYCGHLTKSKIGLSDFFIESSYKDTTGRNLKCYEITKLGCEMVANKLTGEKGTVFTAEYVKKFNEMEQEKNHLLTNYLRMSEAERAKAYFDEVIKSEKLKPKAEGFDNFLSTEKTYTFTETAKTISTKFEEENVDIKLSAIKLTKFLREQGVLSKTRTPSKTDIYGKVKNGKFKNLPNKDYEDYFNVIMVEGEHGTTQTRVKANGVEFIYNLLKANLN